MTHRAEYLWLPNRPRFTDVEGLAAMVGQGDSLGVGGHHFARLPIALLRAIASSGIKDLRYVCWAGGLPLELLLEADAVAEIDLCFSSLDISACRRVSCCCRDRRNTGSRLTALAMIRRCGRRSEPAVDAVPASGGSDMLARVPGASAASDPLPD